MRTSHALLLAVSVLGSASVGSDQAAAENILIENQLSKWKHDGTVANPLPVDVKKGDVVEFNVTGPHGVVTLDKPGNQMPAPALELVLACGEDPASKPNHVLREVECGAVSQFNKQLQGPMKLEVADKFQNDVHFWCIVHRANMWGTFKLKSKS